MRGPLQWIAIAVALLAPFPYLESRPLEISGGFESADLTEHISTLEDPGCPDLDKVQNVSKEAWKGGHVRPPHFGYAKTCVWTSFSLESKDFEGHLFLESRTPFVDSITLYCQNGNGWSTATAGDAHPFTERALMHRFPNFRIYVPANASIPCYLRTQSNGLIVVPLVLRTLQNTLNSSLTEYAFFGFFFGAMLVLILYNALVLFFTRMAPYLWLCLCGLFLAMTLSLQTGFLVQFIFVENAWISNALTLISSSGFAMSAFYFGRSSMVLGGATLHLRDALYFGVLAALLGFGFFVSFHIAAIIVNLSLILVMGLNVWRGIRGVRQNLFAFPYFFAGWLLGLVSTVVTVLYNLGVPFLDAHTALGFITAATISEGLFFTYALSRLRETKSRIRQVTLDLHRDRGSSRLW